jgi:ATP-dependent RNA helicase RhlE
LKTFTELNLIEPLQRAIAGENYKIPTPIQSQTIPVALKRRDVLGCAQTGTGKTAAFALPILNRLGLQNRSAKAKRPFALVLAPTRELAVQIGTSFATYGKHLKLRHALVYGGVSQTSQVRSLQRGVHTVIATPGRLLDLMNQGFIQLDKLEVFVLDEADRMLDMGFMPDIKRIIRELPAKRQSLFFSATMAPAIVEITDKLLVDPVKVDVTPKTRSVKKIKQQVIFVPRKGKPELLQRILSSRGDLRAIVFTKTKRSANFVTERLNKEGLKAAAIHGNKSQNARQRALDAFRNQFVKILVATDVAARGIDIEGVTHVVNFDLPMEPEAYVHRIGRTGRAGAKGIAISFCSAGDQGDLKSIEKLIDQEIPVNQELSVTLPSSSPNSTRGRTGRKSSGGGRSGTSQGGRSRKGSGSRGSGDESTGSEKGKRTTKRRRRRVRTEKASAVKSARTGESSAKKSSKKPGGGKRASAGRGDRIHRKTPKTSTQR